MKLSAIGQVYENFPNGRVFIKRGDRLVTIKVYGTWKGQMTGLDGWICVSWKSRKPIIYHFNERIGIKNITYNPLKTELNRLLAEVDNQTTKDKHKFRAIKNKLLTLCSQVSLQNYGSLEELQAEILKSWFPLLSSYNAQDIQSFMTILVQPEVRKGLKKDCLKEAVKIWFGKSPKGLVSRIGLLLSPSRSSNSLSKRLNQLTLVLSTKKWKIDYLYALLDIHVFCYFPLDIEQVEYLFSVYPERRWLSILEKYNYTKRYREFVVLDDAIKMINQVKHLNPIFPSRPRSIEQLHSWAICTSLELKGHEQKQTKLPLPKQFLQLDGLKVKDLEISIPKTGNDLIQWGSRIKLDNCLHSYIQKVLDRKCFIIGILENGVIRYAISIYGQKIGQFYGKNNSLPDPSHERDIRKLLRQQRVI